MQPGTVMLVCYNPPCETHEMGTIYTPTTTTPIGGGVGEFEGRQQPLPATPTGPLVPPCQSALDTVLSYGTLESRLEGAAPPRPVLHFFFPDTEGMPQLSCETHQTGIMHTAMLLSPPA